LPGLSRNRKLGFADGLGRFPRIDVEKSSSHPLSQTEIDGDNPCSRHLSEVTPVPANTRRGLLLHAASNTPPTVGSVSQNANCPKEDRYPDLLCVAWNWNW
jgi:hypothetical protein